MFQRTITLAACAATLLATTFLLPGAATADTAPRPAATVAADATVQAKADAKLTADLLGDGHLLWLWLTLAASAAADLHTTTTTVRP